MSIFRKDTRKELTRLNLNINYLEKLIADLGNRIAQVELNSKITIYGKPPLGMLCFGDQITSKSVTTSKVVRLILNYLGKELKDIPNEVKLVDKEDSEGK